MKRKLGPTRRAGRSDGLTRTQAEAELRRHIDTVAVLTGPQRRTVAEAGAAYVEHLEHVMERKRATIQDYRGYLRRLLAPYFGVRTRPRGARWQGRVPAAPAPTVYYEMSLYTAEQELKRARGALAEARTKQAAAERRAADAEKSAADKRKSAQRSSSASMASSYLRSAEQKESEGRKAREKAAEFSTKAADAQTKVVKAEQRLADAKATEDKKRADAERRASKKREDEQRRSERARRAADDARDLEVSRLRAQLADAQSTLDRRPWENVPERITVLFMTAEPDDVAHLRLDREIRQIQEQVRSSKLRDSITFEIRPAVRVADLIQHLNEVQPDVVHFSGHGADAGLVLHDAEDQVRLLSNEDLARVLAVAPKPLKLAVFNSCNSAEQARVAVAHVDAAVGMEQSIGDESARVFAGQLYNSLGFGRPLGQAFEQAKLQVQLTFNSVSGAPTLALADGVDANEIVIVAPPELAA